MRVLKTGRPQSGWAKELECTGKGNGGGGCGALLLVEQDDVFRTHNYCRDDHDVFNTFKCSQCNVLTDIGVVPFTPQYDSENEWIIAHGDFGTK